MSKILVTNIGNRNITHKGKVYQDIYNRNNQDLDFKSFYEWSKWLEEHYEIEKEHLDINIFNPLVVDDPRPNKVVLVYSDQSMLDTRTNQDTIYIANILKKLLEEKYGYSHDQVELKHVNAKVVETGSLMTQYRKLINAIKKQGYEKIIICDAGGTAQQKMALKIMAEYLLDAEQYEVKYAEDNQKVTDVSMMEYRSIIDKEQAIQLIRQGEFSAACHLLNLPIEVGKIIKHKDVAEVLLVHATFRYNGNTEESKKCFNNIKNKITNQLLLDYLNGKVYASNKEFEAFFGDSWMELVDKLFKVNFLFELKNYNAAILTLSQFYEMFTDFLFFESNVIFGSSETNTIEHVTALNDFIKLHYGEMLSNNFQANIHQIPTKVLIGKKYFKGDFQKFYEVLSPFITKTDDSIEQGHINWLRNKVAHEGKFVTEKDVNEKYRYIGYLIVLLNDLFKIDMQNIFLSYIKMIENKFRN